MKKVGLFTCFIDNYGACLQAYAMQSTIESFGHDCDIINYIEPAGYNNKSFLQKIVKNKLTYGIMSLIKKNHAIIYAKKKGFNNFRSKYLKFSAENYKDINSLSPIINSYDCYVCGSDQIWNPLFYNGCNKAYMLGIIPKEITKVAYAPSIGISELPAEYKADFMELVDRIDYVSVREQSGVDIINAETPNKARLVLDPTLLVAKENWIKVASNKKFNNEYILVYMFGEREDLWMFVDYVYQSLKIEVKIITLNARSFENKYTHINNASPNDFINLINHAKLVITDSFHATAFSINLNIPFYSLLRNNKNDKNNMNTRIYSLLNLVELNDRLVNSFDDAFNIDTIMNFDNANALLLKKRFEDKEFFRTALLGDKND